MEKEFTADGKANIFTEDTDLNIAKSWLTGSTNGGTWSITARFLPRITAKDWRYEAIEMQVDEVIGACPYWKVDDIRLEPRAKKMVDGLNALIEDINAHPEKYFGKPEGKVEEEKSAREEAEILKDLMDAIIEHESNRDAEWDFIEKHGVSGQYWNDEETEEHDQILADIKDSHDRIQGLIREATGDTEFWL